MQDIAVAVGNPYTGRIQPNIVKKDENTSCNEREINGYILTCLVASLPQQFSSTSYLSMTSCWRGFDCWRMVLSKNKIGCLTIKNCWHQYPTDEEQELLYKAINVSINPLQFRRPNHVRSNEDRRVESIRRQ